MASFSLICVGRMWERGTFGGVGVWRRRVISWGRMAEIWRGVEQKRKGFCPKCPGVLGEERGESWAKRGTLSAVSPFPLGGLFSS